METVQNFVTRILTVLLFYIKTEDSFEDISSNVEKWYDTSNYDKNDKKPLPIGRKIDDRICCT